jgi:hypothetical protein
MKTYNVKLPVLVIHIARMHVKVDRHQVFIRKLYIKLRCGQPHSSLNAMKIKPEFRVPKLWKKKKQDFFLRCE